MKTKPLVLLAVAALFLTLQTLWAQSPTPSATSSPCPSPMTCPNRMGWAEGLVSNGAYPAPPFPQGDTAIKTVNKVDHPDDCDFQEWSWEAFIWATGIGPDGRARFTTLHNADELFGNPKAAKAKGPKPLNLKPRDLKPMGAPKAGSGDEAAQAGGGLIVDQNGQIVWYSTHMNDAYFNFVKANGGSNYANVPPTRNFPGSDASPTPPKATPTPTITPAAVFKASWKVVGPGDDTTKFYTEDTTVPMLVPNPCGGVMVDPSGKTRPVKVALVGLHVVGVTLNHPEFLWATFEQNNNAPDLPAGMDPTSSSPVSPNAYTFYAANTAANKCNIKAGFSGNPPLTITDPVKQTIAPITNIFRQYATGNACPTRTQDIMAVNTASQQALAQVATPSKRPNPPNPKEAIWANYKLIGTLWLNANTLKPNDPNMVAEGIGSVNLANSTLETFFQGNTVSCFLCHNTQPPFGVTNGVAKNINISHVIVGLIPPAPNASPTPTCTPASAATTAASSTPSPSH